MTVDIAGSGNLEATSTDCEQFCPQSIVILVALLEIVTYMRVHTRRASTNLDSICALGGLLYYSVAGQRQGFAV